MSSKKPNKQTGIILPITFTILLAVNGLVICIANKLFPQFIVLGTQFIPAYWAVIHSSVALSLINTFAIPLIRELENKKGRMLTSQEWMIKYFALNFVGLWTISRLADQLGMGISSWVVVLILAVVLDIAQGMSMMMLEKHRQKN